MNLSSLTQEDVEMIEGIISMHEDRGPCGYGWQSDELKLLAEKLHEIVYGDNK